jgi:hypothetical protein
MPQGGEHPNGRETKGFREFSSDNEPSRLFLSEHVVEELPSSNTTIVQTIRALGPFAEFLKRETADPQEFLLKALAKHRVVILG